jgi:hypothetical protein
MRDETLYVDSGFSVLAFGAETPPEAFMPGRAAEIC